MPSPLGKAIKLAASPEGRRAIHKAARFARSEEGRKLMAQAHQVVRTPEGRKLIEQAFATARRTTDQPTSSGSDARLAALRKFFSQNP